MQRIRQLFPPGGGAASCCRPICPPPHVSLSTCHIITSCRAVERYLFSYYRMEQKIAVSVTLGQPAGQPAGRLRQAKQSTVLQIDPVGKWRWFFRLRSLLLLLLELIGFGRTVSAREPLRIHSSSLLATKSSAFRKKIISVATSGFSPGGSGSFSAFEFGQPNLYEPLQMGTFSLFLPTSQGISLCFY